MRGLIRFLAVFFFPPTAVSGCPRGETEYRFGGDLLGVYVEITGMHPKS